MKIAFWNCRGFRKKNFWTDVKISSQNDHLDMLMLAEIKSNVEPPESIWRGAGFDNICFVPSLGFSGGLCLVWKNKHQNNECIKIQIIDVRFVVINLINYDLNFSCNILDLCTPK